MSYAGGVLLAIAAVVVVTGALVQISLYRRGLHIITPTQFVLRLVTACLLLLVIGMIFWGVVHSWANPLHELIYWSLLFVVALLIIILAFIDLRQVRVARDLREAELYLRLARDAAQLPKRDKPSQTGGPGDAM